MIKKSRNNNIPRKNAPKNLPLPKSHTRLKAPPSKLPPAKPVVEPPLVSFPKEFNDLSTTAPTKSTHAQSKIDLSEARATIKEVMAEYRPKFQKGS